jgi:hypothetical protein
MRGMSTFTAAFSKASLLPKSSYFLADPTRKDQLLVFLLERCPGVLDEETLFL